MSKQYIQTYRGFEIYLDAISYHCPRLQLFGFASDGALIRAISKKLGRRRAG